MPTDSKSVTDLAKPAKKKLTSRTSFKIAVGSIAGAAFVGTALYQGQSIIFNVLANHPQTVTSTPTAKGPIDVQLGYADLQDNLRPRLEKLDYNVTPQQEWKDFRIGDTSLTTPMFDRPAQAGLRIIDDLGTTISDSRRPFHIYQSFDAIPSLLVKSLSVVEDKKIIKGLDIEEDKDEMALLSVNPAIDFWRVGKAVAKKAQGKKNVEGGSGLATQYAKQVGSPTGLTDGIPDKLSQMLYASLSMYAKGLDTTESQKDQILKYINAVPFTAHPAYGEVIGFRDAMAIWFGNPDFEKILAGPRTDEKARTYRQMLSVVMALKQPDRYLKKEKWFALLQQRVDRHLPRLVEKGIISADFSKMISAQKLEFAEVGANPSIPATVLKEKHTRTLVQNLIRELGMDPASAAYKLDRRDMRVETTLDQATTRAVHDEIVSFKDPKIAKAKGLIGPKLLDEKNASKIIWSVLITENMPDGREYVRVSTDTHEGALDMNQGGRLSYGSTSKLRMAATYLDIMARLHTEYKDKTPAELKALNIARKDKLSQWAASYMANPATNKELSAMLQSAVEREYSAAPRGFFAGGGMEYPGNYQKSDNDKSYSVQSALWNSVNLPWFRIAEDIQEHYTSHILGIDPEIYNPSSLQASTQESRKEYLKKFADYEGKKFQYGFWKKMKDKNADSITDHLIAKAKGRRQALAVIYTMFTPERSYEGFASFMQKHCKKCLPQEKLEKLYNQHVKPDGTLAFSLKDQGYLAGIHPHELSMAAHLMSPDKPRLAAILKSTEQERQDVYSWLMSPKKTRAQNKAIRILVERAAWKAIEQQWRTTGYDGNLPASPGAVISASDTPQALAKFQGILLNRGRKTKLTSIKAIHFGEGTPHETHVVPNQPDVEQIFRPEVNDMLIALTEGVVQEGTAAKLRDGIVIKGRRLQFAGKTGTNDGKSHKREVAGGRIVAFTGRIGRFAVVVSAYLPAATANDKFTSGTATQGIKNIQLLLVPMLERSYDRNQSWQNEMMLQAGLKPSRQKIPFALKKDPYSLTEIFPREKEVRIMSLPEQAFERLQMPAPVSLKLN